MEFDNELMRKIIIYINANPNLYYSIDNYVCHNWSDILPGERTNQEIVRKHIEYLADIHLLKRDNQGYARAELSNEHGRQFYDIVRDDGEWKKIQQWCAGHMINDFNRMIHNWIRYSMPIQQKEQLNYTLDMILMAIGANAQVEHRDAIEQNRLLQELQTLLSARDEQGLKAWLQEHGLEGIGILISALLQILV